MPNINELIINLLYKKYRIGTSLVLAISRTYFHLIKPILIMMTYKNLFSWVARIIVSIILLQTLFFKFTGAPESTYIFETIGLEPIGRFSSGIVELIAGILILLPSTKIWGALLAMGTMIGAIFFHLTTLGIVINGDGGLLFGMAVTTFILSTAVLFLYKEELPFLSFFLIDVQKIQSQI